MTAANAVAYRLYPDKRADITTPSVSGGAADEKPVETI